MEIRIETLAIGNADAQIVWLKDGAISRVIVIDGGNPGDGEKVVAHLDSFVLPFAGRRAPDVVISTHPDRDHIGGLIEVVRHYGSNIGEVWVHDPGRHVGVDKYRLFKETLNRRASEGNIRMLLESFNQLDWFLALVDHYQIPRREPFYPLQVGPVRVLGPSVEYYRTLLPDFRDLEAYILREAEIEYFSSIRTFRNSLLREIFESVEDTSPCPVVDQNNECSAENDSSAVIEINVDGRYYLFTADAGVAAFDDIRARGELNRVHWLDVPHHGSRRNLTSDIIGILRPETASISAEGDSKHPRKAVINCLKKHGANVYSTHRSGNLRHTFGNFPATVGYATAIPL